MEKYPIAKDEDNVDSTYAICPNCGEHTKTMAVKPIPPTDKSVGILGVIL